VLVSNTPVVALPAAPDLGLRRAEHLFHHRRYAFAAVEQALDNRRPCLDVGMLQMLEVFVARVRPVGTAHRERTRFGRLTRRLSR
jgi:hypothetical protein